MKIYFAGPKKVYADINGFTVKTDQGIMAGGEAGHPEPFTLFLASLGTCAGIFVKGFCDQRGIPTDQIYLTQEQQYDPVKRMIGKIDITIHIPSDFPEKYEQALIQTASLCTVKRHLKEEVGINVVTARK
jgi:ribosomal protein S12 methylthiotransferase accessory factor